MTIVCTGKITVYSRCSYAMNGIINAELEWSGIVGYVRSISDVVWLHNKLSDCDKKVLLIIHRSVVPYVDFIKLVIKNLVGIYPPSKVEDLYKMRSNVVLNKMKLIKISYRDRQILKLMMSSNSFYSLSRTTGISVKTLYSRKKSIYKKLGLSKSGQRISNDVIDFILNL